MRRTFLFIMLGCMAAAVGALILFAVGGSATPEPSRANFHRLRLGMTMEHVEKIIGPAGLSISSDSGYEVYFINGPEGMIWVYVNENRVRGLLFRSTGPESMFMRFK
jgi:hypothetical protein